MSVRKSFKTPKGTELPILNLRGKEYLQVAHRLVWFREDHPMGTIRTTMREKGGEGKDEYAVFQAEIHVMTDRGPMLVSTAHKKETRSGFEDFIEKAETGSIGRALALMGYGTQFAADELEEGDRLADAPVPTPASKGVTSAEVETAVKSVMAEAEVKANIAAGAPAKRTSFRKNVVVNGSGAASTDDI